MTLVDGLLPTPPARYSLVGGAWTSSPQSGDKIPTVVIKEPPIAPVAPTLSAYPLDRPVESLDSENCDWSNRQYIVTKTTQIGSQKIIRKMKNTFLEFAVEHDLPILQRSVSWATSVPPKICREPGGCLPPPRPITTYMIRNIPTRFTSVSFVRLLEEFGFDKTFDFFYLPMDFRSGKNMGYAFINFKDFETGIDFVDKFDSKRLPVSTSKKVVQVYPSRRQGLLENISLFRTSDLLSSSVSLPYYKPLVAVEDGSLVPLSDVNFLVQRGL